MQEQKDTSNNLQNWDIDLRKEEPAFRTVMPPKIAKIVKDFLVKNEMEDLLKKLCWFSVPD